MTNKMVEENQRFSEQSKIKDFRCSEHYVFENHKNSNF